MNCKEDFSTLYSNIPRRKIREAKRLSVRMCRAKGYIESSSDALELVVLNLSRWEEKKAPTGINSNRFLVSKNKFKKLTRS